jgi:methylglutaconyl-CoA hydratase
MNYQYLLLKKEKGIAVITFNRAEKRNAMNGEMIKEIAAVLTTLENDEQVNVVIINGSGEHFCAGADINWMKTTGTLSLEDNQRDAQNLANLLYQLYEFPKPTIALAHGAVLGGGLGIIAVCDIALAAKNASFGFPEAKIGIAPSTISPYVMAAIGERAAHYYFLTGIRFDAAEGYRIGLIHQVIDDTGLYQAGHALAQILLQNGPQALISIKQLIHRVAGEKITPALGQFTSSHLAHLRTSPEAQEGLKAFLEKRAPQWIVET